MCLNDVTKFCLSRADDGWRLTGDGDTQIRQTLKQWTLVCTVRVLVHYKGRVSIQKERETHRQTHRHTAFHSIPFETSIALRYEYIPVSWSGPRSPYLMYIYCTCTATCTGLANRKYKYTTGIGTYCRVGRYSYTTGLAANRYRTEYPYSTGTGTSTGTCSESTKSTASVQVPVSADHSMSQMFANRSSTE